jgi:hypothetical protein
MAYHTPQVQQQGKACRTLHQGADRGTTKTQDEVAFPMTPHGPIGCFCRTLLIIISGEMKVLPRPRACALGIRNARPVRKQAVSSRRNAPRP